MTPAMPRPYGLWETYETSAVRHWSRALVPVAVATGVVWHLARALALGAGPASSWVWLAFVYAAGIVLVFGAVTLHLGNYPLKRWLWRVPAFALTVAAAEVATTAVLIALGVEPLGSGRATWADLPSQATWTVLVRAGSLVVYGAVLAVVVQGMRRAAVVTGSDVDDESGA
jgi:hypothetical protein